eukprot:8133576-Alexandrium_andersonii.AAC.1
MLLVGRFGRRSVCDRLCSCRSVLCRSGVQCQCCFVGSLLICLLALWGRAALAFVLGPRYSGAY